MLHLTTVYTLLKGFSGAKQISKIRLTSLNLLREKDSKGRYGWNMAVTVRNAAQKSIESWIPVTFLELQHDLRLIWKLDDENTEIETEIETMMEKSRSPITTIPGMGFGMTVMIQVEVQDLFILIPSYWPTPEYHLLTTSPGSSRTVTLTWRSMALDTCVTLFTTQPGMLVSGT